MESLETKVANLEQRVENVLDILLEAMKEQDERIASLENEIEELQYAATEAVSG